MPYFLGRDAAPRRCRIIFGLQTGTVMYMRRVALLLLLTSLCVEAQFSSLAVTDDGGQLYFLSERPLKSERSLMKPAVGIYRIERQPDGTYVPPIVFRAPSTTTKSEIYERLDVGTTGDGTAVLWNEATHPLCGKLCNSLPFTIIGMLGSTGIENVETYSGRSRISRNGRYLLSISAKALVDRAQKTPVYVSVALPGAPVDQVFGITSNGQVLVRTADKLAIWTPSNLKPVAGGVSYTNAVISDNGSIVAYEDTNNRLTAVDAASGRILWTAADSGNPSLSNDGQRLLFTQKVNGETQVFLATLTGSSGIRQLTSATGGVRSAILAGFGTRAFAVTGSDGDLTEIDILAGTNRRLVSGPPKVRLDEFLVVAPGKVGNVPSPFEGQLLVNGVRAASLGGGRFQIPWRLEPGTDAEIQIESDSPFGETARSTVRLRAPSFPSYADVHYFRPGQVVSFWGYGLGRVTPYVAEGQITPASPLADLNDPLRCIVRPPGVDPGLAAEVLFAGLAPGMTGVYQVNLRLPETIPQFGFVFCDPDTPYSSILASFRSAPQP